MLFIRPNIHFFCSSSVASLCLAYIFFLSKMSINFRHHLGFTRLYLSYLHWSWLIILHNKWYFMRWRYSTNLFSSSTPIFSPTIDSQKFQCPNNKNAQYEDEVQCDKYFDCVDGVARERLCPDGLVFDPTIRRLNKCDQPFNVDCGDRTELRKWLIQSK